MEIKILEKCYFYTIFTLEKCIFLVFMLVYK